MAIGCTYLGMHHQEGLYDSIDEAKLLLCPYSNCEDGVFNSNLYFQLIIHSICHANISPNRLRL